jgi:hypothetical protein
MLLFRLIRNLFEDSIVLPRYKVVHSGDRERLHLQVLPSLDLHDDYWLIDLIEEQLSNPP